jgi:hypothetical protein
MSVAFVNTGAVSWGNAGISPPLPSGEAQNQFLFAIGCDAANASSGTIVFPSGYTSPTNGVRRSGSVGWCWKIAGASESAPPFTYGTANVDNGAVVFAFSGTATSLDTTPANETSDVATSTTGLIYPTFTPASNQSAVVLWGYVAGDLTASSTLAGWTNIFNSVSPTNAYTLVAFYQIQTTATTIAAGAIALSGAATGVSTSAFIASIPISPAAIYTPFTQTQFFQNDRYVYY